MKITNQRAPFTDWFAFCTITSLSKDNTLIKLRKKERYRKKSQNKLLNNRNRMHRIFPQEQQIFQRETNSYLLPQAWDEL